MTGKFFERAGGALAAALLLLGAGVAAPASAQVTGGDNGNGTIGGNASGLHWGVLTGPTAWTQFTQVTAFAQGWAAVSMSDSDRALCTKSDAIWYSITDNWGDHHWIANAWDARGTLEHFDQHGHTAYSPKPVGGASLARAQSYNEAIRAWDAARTPQQRGHTSLICSAGFQQSREAPQEEWRTAETAATVSGVYSRNTTVTPQVSAHRPLEAQAGTPLKTEFGKLFDAYFQVVANPATKTYQVTPRGGVLLPGDLEAQAAAALASDAGAPHALLDLSQKNKDGMADGGVLNVSEFQQEASFTATATTASKRTRQCEERSTDGGATWSLAACGPWSEWQEQGTVVGAPTGLLPLQRQVGFWQLFTVHCNSEGFQAAVAAAEGATIINSGDPTLHLAAAATSRHYQQQPPRLDFGQPGTPSGSVGFYDKECPFECSADPTGPGASALNGATTNLRDGLPTSSGTVERYGATSGGSNGAKFEFFRDNSPKPLRLDTWYPRTAGVVSYGGEAPLSTTVNRWVEGTPGLSGDSGGKFTMTALGKSIFSTQGTTPKRQRNWEASPSASGPRSAVLPGLVRDFTVQATWASDEGKPQAFNFKWEYAPQVSNTFSTRGLGFGPGGGRVMGELEAVSAPIEGKCYASFGQDSTETAAASLLESTGSGTTNKLDSTLLGLEEGAAPQEDGQTLFVRFVRATGE